MAKVTCVLYDDPVAPDAITNDFRESRSGTGRVEE
jgi:hypothetical protein